MNNFSKSYLEKVLSNTRLNLSDLGGFEHQFERIVANMPKKNIFERYDQIKADGWCVGWLKELFEDVWSVLAIGEPFLHVFEDLLSRHVATDVRHPPLQVRMDVARKLLELMDTNIKDVKEPKSVVESAAQQILKFISLLIIANRKVLSKGDKTSRIYFEESREKLKQRFLKDASDFVGTEMIGGEINSWYSTLDESALVNAKPPLDDEFLDFITKLQPTTDDLLKVYLREK